MPATAQPAPSNAASGDSPAAGSSAKALERVQAEQRGAGPRAALHGGQRRGPARVPDQRRRTARRQSPRAPISPSGTQRITAAAGRRRLAAAERALDRRRRTPAARRLARVPSRPAPMTATRLASRPAGCSSRVNRWSIAPAGPLRWSVAASSSRIPVGSPSPPVPRLCAHAVATRSGAARGARRPLPRGVRLPPLPAPREPHRVVFGNGNADADLMFIGEGPGQQEDVQGLPFVGRAGKLLDQLLEEIGLSRADVFVANVVKCRPPGNRDPQPDEIDSCRPYLHRQIELIEPRLICTLGKFAMQARHAHAPRHHGGARQARGARARRSDGARVSRSSTRPPRCARPGRSTSCATPSPASRRCSRSRRRSPIGAVAPVARSRSRSPSRRR